MISEDIQKEALALVESERVEWDNAYTQVTKKVMFKTKDAIETFRKNYWGVFDDSSPEKVWIPVTEQAVEDSVKNIDLDLKDMRQRALNQNSRKFNNIARVIIHTKLAEKFFGEDMDYLQRSLAIDGTVVWKTWKGKNKEGKMDLMYEQVDLLNFYIDPLAKSIYETDAVIERSTPTIKQFMELPDLENKEEAIATNDVRVYGNNGLAEFSGETKRVEVYERWGLMPEYFVTGVKPKEGESKLIEGRIVTSGTGSSSRLHLIARNPRGLKPYEEAWYKRMPGRWYGRSVAEMVVGFQLWANMIKNIHITRQKVSQLGLWKIRKGSGVTPQMLKGMSVNGAIPVTNMDDLEQIAIQESSPTHFRDMEDIKTWVQAVTSAVSAISPESLPASTPATTAVLNDRNNKSSFTLLRESLGGFFERWMDRQAKEIIFEITKVGDVLSMFGKEAPAELVDQIVNRNAIVSLNEMYKKGIVPTQQELERAMARARQEIKNKDVMITLSDVLKAGDFKTKTVVTNEQIDIAVTVQNIIALIPYIAEQDRAEHIATVFDLMGLPAPTASSTQPQTNQQPNPNQTIQGLTTQANTMQKGVGVV